MYRQRCIVRNLCNYEGTEQLRIYFMEEHILKKKRDLKMITGMILFLLALVVMGGGFWSTVAKEAQKVKQEEALEEERAISAIYVETGEFLKKQFFVNMDTEMVFTAKIPREGIYNKNGKLIPEDVLEVGDMVKIYGDGVITASEPAMYPNITKMKRIGRADLEKTEYYKQIAESQTESEAAAE